MLGRYICRIQELWGSESFLQVFEAMCSRIRHSQGSPKELMLVAMKMKPKFPQKFHYVGYSGDMEHLPIEAAGTK